MTATEAVPRAARTQKQRRTDRAAIGRLELALVIGLAIVAAVPRCINLLGLDPFIDESSWVDWATREFEPTVLASWLAPLLHDGRPPLHFWLMLPIAAVVENGFLAGRLAAALAGVASTLALYGLGREITSRTAALGAALLWALSPYTVLFARIAADDALLALVAILATWSSIVLARRPTIKSGIVLGMMLGLGALTKTTGAMFVLAPPLAILVAGHPRNWRTYVWPLATGALVSIIAVAPIVPWLPQVLAELGRHAAPAGTGWKSAHSEHEIATVWLYQFVGAGLPILAGIGLLAAVGWRQSMLLLVTLLGALWLGLLLATGTSLFARYFLFGVFPVFLLAGYTLDRLATLLGRAVGRASPGNTSASTAARVAIVIVGVGVVLWSRADLLHDVMMDPARAAIPEGEHFRYVEQWLAVYGLGQVADELRARGQQRTVTGRCASRLARGARPDPVWCATGVSSSRCQRALCRGNVAVPRPGSARSPTDRSRRPDLPPGERHLHRRARHPERRPCLHPAPGGSAGARCSGGAPGPAYRPAECTELADAVPARPRRVGHAAFR